MALPVAVAAEHTAVALAEHLGVDLDFRSASCTSLSDGQMSARQNL